MCSKRCEGEVSAELESRASKISHLELDTEHRRQSLNAELLASRVHGVAASTTGVLFGWQLLGVRKSVGEERLARVPTLIRPNQRTESSSLPACWRQLGLQPSCLRAGRDSSRGKGRSSCSRSRIDHSGPQSGADRQRWSE